MSFRTFSGGLPRRFRVVQQSFLHREDLAFAEVLSEQDIQVAFDAAGVRFAQDEGDVYTPSVTLWALLSQAVFKAEHRSCVAAVARVAEKALRANSRSLIITLAAKHGGRITAEIVVASMPCSFRAF